MANVKISELPLTLSVSPTALVPVVQNGTTCSTYACLISGSSPAGTSGVSGSSGSSGATGASGTSGVSVSGTSGTSGGFGAVIIAGSGTLSSVRDGVSNVAAGNYSFAGGGLANSVTPGVTTSTKCFAVTCNTINSFDVTGNVTNYFQDVDATPAIGSSFQGGKVAYILTPMDAGYNPTLVKGIIASNFTLGQNPWTPNYDYTVTGAVGSAIGTGSGNTDLMISVIGSPAALMARNYNGGGYNDWYLPSTDELLKLYDVQNILGDFNQGNPAYWTSTEYDGGQAYYVQFQTGGAGLNGKSDTTGYIRAIRSFSIPKYAGTTPVGASFRGTAGTSGVTLTGWTSAYSYPTTVVAGDENIGVGPYDNVLFTFTDNGAEKSSIVGGNSNVVNGSFSFIGGGGGTAYQYANTICNSASGSFIGAGQGNTIKSNGNISSFDQSSFVYTGTTAGTCTYCNIAQCNITTSGSGTGACIDLLFCDNVPYCAQIGGSYCNYGGKGANYKPGDTLTIDGTTFGGTTSVDDLTVSIYEVASANNSAILGGCNNTLAVGAPSFIAGTGININQVSCNYAVCNGNPVPALYVNNLVFANPNNGTSGIATSNPYRCGQVFICNGMLAISGF
jgi:hypothetical protein